MRERLVQSGWSQTETLDEDLGRSAAGWVTRAGFERLASEVSLGPPKRCEFLEMRCVCPDLKGCVPPRLHYYGDTFSRLAHFKAG